MRYLRNNTLINSILPVATTVAAAPRKTMFSLPLSAKAGDILHLDATGEVTSSRNFDIGCVAFASLESTPYSSDGIPITMLNGEVVRSLAAGSQIHKVIHRAVNYEFFFDFVGYVNFILYAYSTAASPTTKLLLGSPSPPPTPYGQIDGFLWELNPNAVYLPAPPDPTPQ